VLEVVVVVVEVPVPVPVEVPVVVGVVVVPVVVGVEVGVGAGAVETPLAEIPNAENTFPAAQDCCVFVSVSVEVADEVIWVKSISSPSWTTTPW
jgi:hypothetical protein